MDGPAVLRVLRLDPRAKLPARAHEGDAGLDLCALDGGSLAPGERAAVRTGLALEIPAGMAGLLLPRSGLARAHGIALANAPGLIDSGYRGEVEVLLLNADRERTFSYRAGERIAQLVLVALPEVGVREARALASSSRGARGFGSSGR
ncbi:MAG TPA: dUTP diphosphatase [Dehalococcoidia bacterium]|nr:dUTP diphosphatase [Dehalococcoidia bacterium]